MKKRTNKPTVKTNEYILLDRSGSMESRWGETLSALNSYVQQLVDKKQNAAITLATFDLHNGFQYEVLRKSVPLKKWKPLDIKEATPRGYTPLFDAMQRTISIAEGANAKRTVILVITDGAENASKEAKRPDVKKSIERIKAKGWQVIFLGADFEDVFRDGRSVGLTMDSMLVTTSGNYNTALRCVAESRTLYASTGASMNFTEEDRLKAKGLT